MLYRVHLALSEIRTHNVTTSQSSLTTAPPVNHSILQLKLYLNTIIKWMLINGVLFLVQPMCPCDCAYKKRLDYWASQGVPNHTMAEWREILTPVLDEIKKNLTVNKANLSATIRRLSSAPDERQSSKSVGLIGIALISFVCASFILIDITSIRRHIAVIREMIGHGRAIE